MEQLIFQTALNGLQFGIFLFLVAGGLTLVLGIMSFVNLAHGSMFMMGAYVAAWVFQQSDSFLLAAIAGLPVILLLGIVIEYLAFRTLYSRDHLDQVLATFGCILFFNQMVLVVFGAESQEFSLPDSINFPFQMFGFTYPFYRLIVILAGILVAIALFLAITRTRTGMRIRAGASNRAMVGALGVNVTALYTIVFGIGAALAGFAGIMIGPIESVESGMGEEKLILAIVVIVIGGIGSIRGAFIASIIVGLVEIGGRVFMTDILRAGLNEEFAQTAGPALASMMIYLLMAAILFFKPEGLFPARTG